MYISLSRSQLLFIQYYFQKGCRCIGQASCLTTAGKKNKFVSAHIIKHRFRFRFYLIQKCHVILYIYIQIQIRRQINSVTGECESKILMFYDKSLHTALCVQNQAKPNEWNEEQIQNNTTKKNEATETNFSLKRRPKTKTNIKWHKIKSTALTKRKCVSGVVVCFAFVDRLSLFSLFFSFAF